MAFLDELGKKISVTSQNVVQKAKGMADISGLKGQISDEEKKIERYYQNLGRMYYETCGKEPLPELAGLTGMIDGSIERIEKIREEIAAIENITTCPVCGAVIEPGMMFCVGCGTRVGEQPQAPAPGTKVCPNCGSRISESALFCTKCGTKQE